MAAFAAHAAATESAAHFEAAIENRQQNIAMLQSEISAKRAELDDAVRGEAYHTATRLKEEENILQKHLRRAKLLPHKSDLGPSQTE